MHGVMKTLGFMGCFFIGMMVLVVIVNILGRLIFERPLKGTIELVEAMMLILAFFAIPYTANKRGHVSVKLIVARLPKRAQDIIRSIGYFLSAGIMGVIAYQATMNTIYYTQNLHETTAILYIPLAPLRLIMALGCLILCIQLILDMFQPTKTEDTSKGDVEI